MVFLIFVGVLLVEYLYVFQIRVAILNSGVKIELRVLAIA